MNLEGRVISRTHLPGDLTEIVYEDSGSLRLGRLYPSSVSHALADSLISLHQREEHEGVLFPDRFENIGSQGLLASITLQSQPRRLSGPVSLKDMIDRIQRLIEAGQGGLSIDRHSLIETEQGFHLVVWNGELLGLSGVLAPEVAAGGYSGTWSVAFSIGSLLREAGRSIDHGLSEEEVEMLLSPIPCIRARAAEKAGIPFGCGDFERLKLPGQGLTTLGGGEWRTRDMAVNHIIGLAVSRGMRARVIRCRSAESHRPLPDVPEGLGPVLNPSDLLSTVFGSTSYMDRLLVIDDFQRASPDLAAIVEQMVTLPPPGLRVVIATCDPEEIPFESPRHIHLEKGPSSGEDIDLGSALSHGLACGLPGPSWYGPRFRCPRENLAVESDVDDIEYLFRIGADRVIASISSSITPRHEQAVQAASSLIRLGRHADALRLLPEGEILLRGKALVSMGRTVEALPLLRKAFEEAGSEESRCLLAKALISSGGLGEAEKILRDGRSGSSMVILADLLDSTGRPAESLEPLRSAEKRETGDRLVPILCARARAYMRLGRYDEALEASDRAVSMAGVSGHGSFLMDSLLTRGRVREVLGAWEEALDDYRIAVSLFNSGSMKSKRPPHVDLYVLLLRMGRLEEADDCWKRLDAAMTGIAGKPRRMEYMLRSYRSTLLGDWKEGLPVARMATELAAQEENPLHQAICTLYVGMLTVMAGRRSEGLDYIRKARSSASLLGDRHLVLLCDLELAAAGEETREDLRLCAEELNMLVESLRASVLQEGDPEALERLLEMPAPLEALAAACRTDISLSGSLYTRMQAVIDRIAVQLPSNEAESLHEMLRTLEPSGGIPEDQDPDDILEIVSGWARQRADEGAGLKELAALLGLDELDNRCRNKCDVELSRDPPLFASAGRPGLQRVAPLLASLVSCTAERSTPVHGSSQRYPRLLGGSSAMEKLRVSLDRTAASSVPVLLLGETGTGKELSARAIHRVRGVRGHFVPVDCGAIPAELLESELFGARRGAYTGSREDRKGLIEEAHGGTLFLDEIGNLPEQLQVKMLRVLDSGRFRRLGENMERGSSFQLLCATNSDLLGAVKRGEFRDDLYYRIAVMVISLPPLRERREDIPMLAVHFLGEISGNGEVEITSGALRELESYDWPGNVRELKNIIQRAYAISGGNRIERRHIVFDGPIVSGTSPSMETLKMAMARHVKSVVDQLDGNRTRAAMVLDCTPKTVRKYIAIAEGVE